MTYGYIRVSTEHQNLENQQLEIEKFCQSKGIKIDYWIREKISGTKNPQSRKLGKVLMNQVVSGDLIICTEISRFGRSMIMIMNILQYFLENEIKVWTIKDGFRLGDNIQSKVLAFAFGLSAEIERQLISERTKQGLNRARLEGKVLGRRKGSHPKNYKLTSKENYIEEQLKNGRSIRSLAKELGVVTKTLKTHIQRMQME